jgi:hypothetical protein
MVWTFMITAPPPWLLLLLLLLLRVCCSLKELVRRVAEQRALELTERLCEKVLSTSKKDTNARDVARWGQHRPATRQHSDSCMQCSTGQHGGAMNIEGGSAGVDGGITPCCSCKE